MYSMTENLTSTNIKEKPIVILEKGYLWNRFDKLHNEMIITRPGRRMFPIITLDISGLISNNMYSIILEFILISGHKWKYQNFQWVALETAALPSENCFYEHPQSPNYGEHWMKKPVSFSTVRLSNQSNDKNLVKLNSFHRYQPNIRIVKVDGIIKTTVSIHSFSETKFVAVTAYQNDEVETNPYSKAIYKRKCNEMKNEDEYNSQSNVHYQSTNVGIRQGEYLSFGYLYFFSIYSSLILKLITVSTRHAQPITSSNEQYPSLLSKMSSSSHLHSYFPSPQWFGSSCAHFEHPASTRKQSGVPQMLQHEPASSTYNTGGYVYENAVVTLQTGNKTMHYDQEELNIFTF
ncbi:T-box transcription factor tbx19 [Chamberlinius hualienensis]